LHKAIFCFALATLTIWGEYELLE
jgi:hypothetical protein